MKTLWLLFALPVVTIVANAQAPNFLWAKSTEGISEDQVQSIATDANGNAYITGYFYSPAITFSTTTLTNAGGQDIFIAKFDSGGSVLWAKSEGGIKYDYGQGIATDANGNIYVSGQFSSPTITFDTITLTNAVNIYTYDIFIAKIGGDATSIAEKHSFGQNNLILYPNPNTGKFILEVNTNQNQETDIEILNSLSQTVSQQHKQLTSGKNTLYLNIGDQPKGIYFIKIKIENTSINKKIIIQ